MRARFLWHLPYLQRVQEVLDGVSRGPTGPLGPLELAALRQARRMGPLRTPLRTPRGPLKTQYNPLKSLLGTPDFGDRLVSQKKKKSRTFG